MLSVFSPVHMVDENLQDTSLLASKSERFVSKRECSSPWILFRRTMNWQVVDGEWL